MYLYFVISPSYTLNSPSLVFYKLAVTADRPEQKVYYQQSDTRDEEVSTVCKVRKFSPGAKYGGFS